MGQDDEGETGKQMEEKYEYDAIVEQKLVEFFSENDCFYNKGSEKYANTKYKKMLLLPLAAAVAVEGVAVVFLAPLPSSKCQTFHEFSCRYARTQNVQE